MKLSALKISFILFLLILLTRVTVVGAYAAPHFTFSPSSGSYTNGASFAVVLGADSGVEKVVAMDIVGTFDATKLEISSIEKASSAAFNFDYGANTAIIHNDTGKFELTLAPSGSSVYDGVVVNGSLLVINFRAKAVGTASVNLTCQSGSVTESNIINQSSADMVDCASNQSGSYTITEASSGTNPTSTFAPAAATSVPTAAATTTTSELPRTGGLTETLGLVIFGMAAMGCALFLRVL